MKKLLTFGEIMMRLQPPDCNRLEYTNKLDVSFGGGEANVAVCCSRLNIPSIFVTKLPKNPLGDACVGELRRHGIDTTFILRGGKRMGVYFCEKGFSERPSRVYYDREGSAINDIVESEIDWEKSFNDVDWFHFTGITPALSSRCCEEVETALKIAKKLGITVSCDLNYRSKLWSREKACEVMSKFMKYIDVLIANEEDSKDVFGIVADSSEITSGVLNEKGYEQVCEKISDRFGIKTIAITLRKSYSANRNGWSAILFKDNQFYKSVNYDINVLDRVGGGDAFAAGIIYSIKNGYDNKASIDYAVACSCIKHSINGDFNIINDEEVKSLLKSGGNGRVVR